jgi:hypothetical protein
MANRTKKTPKKESQFLEVLRKTADVSKACKTIKTGRATVYEWRKKDSLFAAAWDDAIEEAIETAEGEAYRRATKGTLKPVFYKGVKCGSIREYSDTLLIFLLKAGKPEKYRERFEQRIEGELTANIVRVPVKQSQEEWEQSQLNSE